MLSYIALDIAVLAGLALLIVLRPQKLDGKPIGSALVVLLVMTAVFDSLIIANGIVAYDTAKILGLYIGKAPVEDFAYTLAAVVLIPYLWKHYASKD